MAESPTNRHASGATSVKKEFEIVTHASEGEALRPPSLEGKDKYASVKVISRSEYVHGP